MDSTVLHHSQFLKHLVGSPTRNQDYIYELWNRLHFGAPAEPAWSQGEILHKNLKFLFPCHELLSSIFDLPGVESAIAIVHDLFHKRGEKKVLFYGDRDADGICSTSILYLFFRDKMGIAEANMTLMLPGEEDKYGLTLDIAEKIVERRPDILITLDNGSSNRESFGAIRAALPGVKTIIIDHHSLPKSPEDYPDVDAFINPVMLAEKDSRRNMCTSGLAYLFIYAVAWSFTDEYDKITLVRNENPENDIYIKNGTRIDSNKYDKIFYLKSSIMGSAKNSTEPSNDFAALWNAECSQNFRLNKINNFLKSYPDTLGIPEKIAIFQNIKMKNVYRKVHEFLPLAAIGTVADSMLLTDDNRILVHEGLAMINENKSTLVTGLKEIIKAMELFNVNINEQDLAFTICPAVNAPGRMGQARMALDAIVVKDPLECARNSFLLKEQNEKRKFMSSESMRLLEGSLNSPDDAVVVCYHEQIHRGISGIVAGKLAEKYEKPALVLVNDGQYLRGSVRSYKNENVLAIIQELAPWFVQYGGHLQAAGFSLEHAKRKDFTAQFIATAARLLVKTGDAEPAPDGPVIHLRDVELTPSLWKELLVFAPYGNGNPRPKLSISPTGEITYKLMGKEKNHARVNFTAVKNGSIEAVWFNFGKELYNLENYQTLKVLTEPQINYFRGVEKYQLRIIEVR